MAFFQRCARAARRRTQRCPPIKTRQLRTQNTSFRPAIEQLETRDVPAVTVSLAAGVLTVNGTTANDSIVLHQSGGRVSIGGVANTWTSTSVNSVVVNSGAGNDYVSLVGIEGSAVDQAGHRQ